VVEVKATLAEVAPQMAAAERTEPATTEQRSSTAAKTWGLAVTNLSDAERQKLRGSGGVKITAVSGGAEAVGLRAGDVILGVGTSDVSDVKQFEAALARFEKLRALPVTVLRGDWASFVRIPASR
jgi:serine protease Do